MPVNHSFQVEVEIEIPATAEAGIQLSGRGSWATVGLRDGQTIATWSGVANYVVYGTHRIFVRLRSIHYDVSCDYSSDGKEWMPFPNATEVTGGSRLSLYAAGSGQVVFRNFEYRGLD